MDRTSDLNNLSTVVAAALLAAGTVGTMGATP
jgi:hypothetical protein